MFSVEGQEKLLITRQSDKCYNGLKCEGSVSTEEHPTQLWGQRRLPEEGGVQVEQAGESVFGAERNGCVKAQVERCVVYSGGATWDSGCYSGGGDRGRARVSDEVQREGGLDPGGP